MSNLFGADKGKKDDSKSNYLMYAGLLAAGVVAVGTGWYFLKQHVVSKSEEYEYGGARISNATTSGRTNTGETGSSLNRGGEEEAKHIELPKPPTIPIVVSINTSEKDSDTVRREQYEETTKRLASLKRWNYKNGTLQVEIVKAENVDKKDLSSESDPYVELRLGDKTQKTKWYEDEKNPTWNEIFQFAVKDATRDVLLLQVYDHNTVSDTKIGDLIHFPVVDVIKRDGVIEQFGFKVPNTKTTKLYLSLKYRED